MRPARAVAVVVGRQVVGDPDQPRPQRPAVRLALRALEVAVGLEEGLLRQVLGVVVVADPVVGVAVDVAQMCAVEIGEIPVQALLVRRRSPTMRSLLGRAGPSGRTRSRAPRRVDRMLSSHCSGEASPSSTRRAPWSPARRCPRARTRGRAAARWRATRPSGRASARRRAQAARRPPARPRGGCGCPRRGRWPRGRRRRRARRRSRSARRWQRQRMDLGEDASGGGPGQVRPARRGGRGRERGGVLGAGGQLGSGHVVGGVHAEPAGLEHLAQLAPEVARRGWRGPPRRPARSPRARARDRPARPRRVRGPARRRRRTAWCRAAARGPWTRRARRCARPRARRCRPPRRAGRGRARPARPGRRRRTPRRAARTPRSPVELHAGQVVGVLAARGEARGLLARCGRRASPRVPPARARAAAAVPIDPAPTTAAVRSGGSPPSHSHWSATQGQMRSVTSPARKGDGLVHAREGERRAEAQVHLHRPDPPAAPGVLAAAHRDGHHRSAALERQAAHAAVRVPSEPRVMRVPSGKITTTWPRSRSISEVFIDSSSDSPRLTREGAEAVEEPAGSGF